ncbi:uncharacterized protein LOC116005012 [Ipomoea triloba]|uniref:uncharacterized protein LOC116005012 n=1 Tax=Ipomoea triloba TaxID=35885 RepID=UPI00125E3302|nr:uncharacterized protein LOC116005012 [Ipomoea triloba]
MANNVSRLHSSLLLVFFLLLILASHHLIQGTAESSRTPLIVPSTRESHSQGGERRWVDKNPRKIVPNPESLDLSQPRNVGVRDKLLDVFQRSISFSKNDPRRIVLNSQNPKSRDLSQPKNLGGGGKLLNVFQWSTDFPKTPRRLMIGSVAPTCTYNECKGCKYKCRAEQVPVEGNDPINSPYHYKCVCHR